MNVKALFRYESRDMLIAALSFLGVMVLVLAVVFITARAAVSADGGGSGYFSAMEMASAVTCLVIGIVSIREDLRLALQNGIGRRSTALSFLLCTALISALLAVGGELLTELAQLASPIVPQLQINSLYEMVYETRVAQLSPLAAHAESILLTLLGCMTAMLGGALISLIFFRLNKTWRIVVAVGAPLLLMIGFPTLLPRSFFMKVGEFLAAAISSPGSLMLFLAAVIILAALFNWLLLRRAELK